jgi:hypothetical protein
MGYIARMRSQEQCTTKFLVRKLWGYKSLGMHSFKGDNNVEMWILERKDGKVGRS